MIQTEPCIYRIITLFIGENLQRLITCMGLSFLIISCSTDVKKPGLSETLLIQRDAGQCGISFKNTLQPHNGFNIFEYNYYYNGGGVGVADFNNDGLTDIFFTGNQVSCKMYLNSGNWQFKDVTDKARVKTDTWVTGVAVVDINADGWQDIYLSVAGYSDEVKRKNLLFINKGVDEEGIPLFTEVAGSYGLADSGYSTQAAFFDYDLDGDLDLYVLNHWHDMHNPNYPKQKVNDGSAPSTDRLYKNEGGNRFTDVSKEAGITYEGYGLSVGITDFNNDLFPDIFVANDFVYDDLFYINNGDGTFTESASQVFKHISQFSMGSDIADFNNDGFMDIVGLDILPADRVRQKMMSQAMNQDRFDMMLKIGYMPQHSRNMLHLNNGPGPDGNYSFTEIGQLAGIYKTDWSWSALWVDMDQDGWQDLFITNGIPHDITNLDFIAYRDSRISNPNLGRGQLIKDLIRGLDDLEEVSPQNYFYQNNKDNTFIDNTKAIGLGQNSISNGAAYADLDNDGDLDLIVNNLNAPPFLYENRATQQKTGNSLRLRLQGTDKNPDGLGAKISVFTSTGKKLVRENYRIRGFQSSQSELLHFGTGTDTLAREITITWPDGKKQTVSNVAVDSLIYLNWNDGLNMETKSSYTNNPLFSDITSNANIGFVHKENSFPDYKAEPLLPLRRSDQGPKMSVGDLNGDGLEDFVVSGAAGVPGKVFFQSAGGTFKSKDLPDGGYEDGDMLLFDADNDGDLDLYVVSGGVEYKALTATYQDRLYINNGGGNFTYEKKALPVIVNSGSCVVGGDFDLDGDIDLFVGGRVVPGSYPKPPQSMLLRNDSKKGQVRFVDVTGQHDPGLLSPGMVTDAEWGDYNGDGWPDLIVVGEWMPILFFKNVNGKLTKANPDFKAAPNIGAISTSITGWWQAITAADVDMDGDIDFIAGNFGLNNQFKASPQEPIVLFGKDFDRNGKIEAIYAFYQENVLVPIMGRDAIAGSLPQIKKEFPDYSSFASNTFHGIFTAPMLQDAIGLKASQLASLLFENMGDGTFVIHPLPITAQFGPIKDILVRDFDRDGLIDILVTGNENGSNYRFGNFNGLNILCLKNNGHLDFETLSHANSGISLENQGRALGLIKMGGRNVVISLENNGPVKLFDFPQ